MGNRHLLEARGDALHGHFDRDLEPRLVIDPGDTVTVTTLDCWWSAGPYEGGPIADRERVPQHYADAGHALTGPIAVRGAAAGGTLAITVDDIVPGAYGATVAGGRATKFNEHYGLTEDSAVLSWRVDAGAAVASDQYGHTVTLRPFLGVMGLAPGEPGRHSTIPPRRVGGNLDCKELVRGSTLYLPVEVDGALLSVGDGHAAQGDAEVGGTAIECPMTTTLTIDLAELDTAAPLADTPAGWVTMGLGADVDEATYAALNAMFDLVQQRFAVSRAEAAALASVVVDTRVTQIVNRTVGVHAVLAHDALR